MAGAVGLSKEYFSRLFHKVVGLPFQEYVARRRVARAAELITIDPYRSVTNVAFAAGFKSLRAFEVQFKKFVGEAPSQYRDRQRQR